MKLLFYGKCDCSILLYSQNYPTIKSILIGLFGKARMIIGTIDAYLLWSNEQQQLCFSWFDLYARSLLLIVSLIMWFFKALWKISWQFQWCILQIDKSIHHHVTDNFLKYFALVYWKAVYTMSFGFCARANRLVPLQSLLHHKHNGTSCIAIGEMFPYSYTVFFIAMSICLHIGLYTFKG